MIRSRMRIGLVLLALLALSMVSVLTAFIPRAAFPVSSRAFDGLGARARSQEKPILAAVQQPLPLPPFTKYDWSSHPQHFPISEYHSLPHPARKTLPVVQYNFAARKEHDTSRATRRQRMAQVRSTMKRSWKAYRLKAWMWDELMPIAGMGRTTSCGWAATLVSALDSLWIMGLGAEFEEGVAAAMHVDFSSCNADIVNVYEATTGHLGGLISAFDLSNDRRLLDKAIELANMLYAAFDTPNRMPAVRWDFRATMNREAHTAQEQTILSEIGSLSLEFTRLSQITGDPKWYDAIHRIMLFLELQQHQSRIPGLWPTVVKAAKQDFFSGNTFSLGAWADSTFEYLPKMYALLGGPKNYASIYNAAIEAATKTLLVKPMVPQLTNLLFPGIAETSAHGIVVRPEMQHLSCYSGGMFALGGKLMQNKSHIDLGKRLTVACIWAYRNSPAGIMPETSFLATCDGPGMSHDKCEWNTMEWQKAVRRRASKADIDNSTRAEEIINRDRLPPGITSIPQRHYALRPEAIESMFVLYRITGDRALQEDAWTMFRSIHAFTRTDMAHASRSDVMNATVAVENLWDGMGVEWMGETLKYFYLMFAEEELLSLDKFVFNTKGHPFRLGGVGCGGIGKRKDAGG